MKIIMPPLLFLLVLNCSSGQKTDSILRRKIDSIVKMHMAANDIVGISIGIVKNNKIYYTKGYGTAEINTNKPIDKLTNFHIASISKLFTTTAVMQLVEGGKLDINNKLTYYLPEFEMRDERFKKITIKQMLNHTSGIPDITNYNWEDPKNDNHALKNYVLKSEFEKLKFEPGTDISYSNLAFDILGYIVEKQSYQNFEDYMYEKILKPFGMINSSFDYYKIDSNRRSSPHIKNEISNKVELSRIYPFNKEHSPCGTLNSCTYDLSKWMIENLTIYNDSTNSYEGVISRETLLKMWTPTHNYNHPAVFLGLGWWKRESEKYGNYFFHVGLDLGFSSSLTIFPERNFGIVVLCNGDYPNDIVYNKIPFEIEQLLNEK
jgi:CubicO group peptidase (beta-lactamase class C family)